MKIELDMTQLVTAQDTSARDSHDRRIEALARLVETDWYVIRMMETGQPVPDEIAAMRRAARDRLRA
ncbi:hypothetical protein LCGC14_2149510 [marine sediment metagenome]|uniref:Uncharacterized protein n=1 Tax=marine sediment metagenome TaxID=412755 RepID=A0A0F9DW52_9ZZZZ